MELRALKYFVTAADEKNMTRAAERLGMSQPPLSAQIKNLEDELNVQLMIRGKRTLKLTEAGVQFYRRAKQLLELAEQTKLEMQSLEGLKGCINISLVEGRAPYLLARWIAGFRLEYPQVTFRLWNGDGDEAIDRLQHGLADLALIAAPYDTEQLDGISVGREPWVAVFSKSHPLANEEGDFIPLKSLADLPLIVPSRHSRTEAIRTWFEEIGKEPDIICELSNYIDAEALAEQNVGICIYPLTTYAENDLLEKKIIIDSARQIEYFLVRNRGQHSTDLIQEFLNFVKDSQEEERKGRQTYLMPENEYLPPDGTKFL